MDDPYAFALLTRVQQDKSTTPIVLITHRTTGGCHYYHTYLSIIYLCALPLYTLPSLSSHIAPQVVVVTTVFTTATLLSQPPSTCTSSSSCYSSHLLQRINNPLIAHKHLITHVLLTHSTELFHPSMTRIESMLPLGRAQITYMFLGEHTHAQAHTHTHTLTHTRAHAHAHVHKHTHNKVIKCSIVISADHYMYATCLTMQKFCHLNLTILPHV